MTKTFWLVWGAMLSTSLLAQQATNVPAAGPMAPAQSSDAATAKESPAAANKQSAAKRKAAAAMLRTVPLVAGPARVVANNVNVRGQARLRSEVVTRLTNGQPVTVIEEVLLKKSAADEPSAWAKILLPPGAKAFVNGLYLDSNKAVKASRLNVRSGPGENYSVIGQLLKGDAVHELGTTGDWTQIEPPTNSYAFVAAQYLEQQPTEVISAAPSTPDETTPTEPEPTPATVTEPPIVATAPGDLQAPSNAPPAVVDAPPAVVDADTNVVQDPNMVPEEPPVEEPPPPRIVQREGFVRATTSIQAPTDYELVSTDTGRRINYLFTPSPQLDLSRYKGLRIVVTGEESLDRRWKATPLITIQKIIVIE